MNTNKVYSYPSVKFVVAYTDLQLTRLRLVFRTNDPQLHYAVYFDGLKLVEEREGYTELRNREPAKSLELITTNIPAARERWNTTLEQDRGSLHERVLVDGKRYIDEILSALAQMKSVYTISKKYF